MFTYFKKFFNDKKYLKLLFLLAIPIALQNLLSALLNIVDGIMVSFLPYNNEKMAAILICNQIIFIFSIIIFAIGSASSVFASQFYGKKDLTKVPKCTGISLTISSAATLIFVLATYFFAKPLISIFSNDSLVIEYGTKFMKLVCFSFIPFSISSIINITLRGIRKVYVGFYVLLLGIASNVFFNYVFMFGKLGFPNIDIAGAALGTVIARFVELVAIILICVFKKYPVIASPKNMFSFDRILFKNSLKVMLPAIANEIFWVLGNTCFIAIFGRMENGTAIQAAINITNNIDKLVYVFLIGVGVATSITVGNELGAMKMEQAKESGEKSIAFSFLIGILTGIIMAVLIFFIPKIYSHADITTINLAKKLMIIFSCSMIIRSLNFTLFIGILRGGGDTRYAFILETITIWCIAVPLCIVSALVFKLQPEIVYIFIFSEELIKLFIVFKRFKSGKWQRNLVDGV